MIEDALTDHNCPSCDAKAEYWWNYCAMCGWHIASGLAPVKSHVELRYTETTPPSLVSSTTGKP